MTNGHEIEKNDELASAEDIKVAAVSFYTDEKVLLSGTTKLDESLTVRTDYEPEVSGLEYLQFFALNVDGNDGNEVEYQFISSVNLDISKLHEGSDPFTVEMTVGGEKPTVADLNRFNAVLEALKTEVQQKTEV